MGHERRTEPTEDDEHRALDFIRMAEEVGLRGVAEDDRACAQCHFFADTGDALGYCWHPDVRIGVGVGWFCQRWLRHPGG